MPAASAVREADLVYHECVRTTSCNVGLLYMSTFGVEMENKGMRNGKICNVGKGINKQCLITTVSFPYSMFIMSYLLLSRNE